MTRNASELCSAIHELCVSEPCVRRETPAVCACVGGLCRKIPYVCGLCVPQQAVQGGGQSEQQAPHWGACWLARPFVLAWCGNEMWRGVSIKGARVVCILTVWLGVSALRRMLVLRVVEV